MIEFLAEWLVTLLIPATHVLEVRAPHLSFMFLKEYWFRELYLGFKVTASHPRMKHWLRELWKNGNAPYENKAVAILEQMQSGGPALIQKDGGEMLIAMVLDRPLAEAKSLVERRVPWRDVLWHHPTLPTLKTCYLLLRHAINPELPLKLPPSQWVMGCL